MEPIYIKKSTCYYFVKNEDDKEYTIIDLYNCARDDNGRYILYFRENGKFVKKGTFNYIINYRDIKTYTLDEITSMHELGGFILYKASSSVKLEKSINIRGKCSIRIDSNYNVPNTCFCNLLDYYWFLCRGNNNSCFGYHSTFQLMYDDFVYDIKNCNLYINGKPILQYTSGEISNIMDSNDYMIGVDSESTYVQQFSLDDYYFEVKEQQLFISSKPKKYSFGKKGILESAIKYNKINNITIDRDVNLFKLTELLLKYNIPITIN